MYLEVSKCITVFSGISNDISGISDNLCDISDVISGASGGISNSDGIQKWKTPKG